MMAMDKMIDAAETKTQNSTRQIVIELSSALHMYGVAAHDLEASMAETAQAMGVSAEFFATPTSIFIAFGNAGQHQTTLLRVSPGDVNLDKLCSLYSVQEELTEGSLKADDALTRVRDIVSKSARYGWGWLVPANGLTAAIAVPFFGGGWDEVAISGVLGLIVGCLAWLTSRHARTRNLLAPAASLVVSMAASASSAFLPDTASGIVTVSSLILLIPGLSLTVAMNELATQNLASGTARFIGAMSQMMLLGFGVALGRSLVAIVVEPVGNPPGEGLALPYVIGSLFLASMAFTILFQARPQDWPLICGAGFLAFFGAKTGVQILGPLAGPSLAAALLGVTSNVIARLRRKPASVTLVPGLLLLVPGSVGFTSIINLLDQEPARSFESAFKMVLIAASIVTGLILANVLVPQSTPKKLKRVG